MTQKRRIQTMLILASESPRRRELLKNLGFPFVAEAADIEELEQPENGCSVSVLPRLNAERKASAVSLRYPEDIVIGADTAIVFEDQLIGKPADPADARRILAMLSGREHQVITGLAVIRGGEAPFFRSWSEVSRVNFLPFDEKVIDEYLARVNVLDKAGAYAIQEHGDMIVSGISGELENIIGLPLKTLGTVLGELIPPQSHSGNRV